VLDVNGDGWLDIITINWRTGSIKWIEHPGADVMKDAEWKAHVIAVPGSSESGRLVDLLGDGTPVILPAGAGFAAWWELRRGAKPEWIKHDLPREVAGHGLGSGDINGDGRMDVVGRNGWAEAPKDPRKERWTWHQDFDLEQASIPILVVDVDGDGLNDIVYARAHDFGIYWLNQKRGKDDAIQWVKHAIDHSVAGAHAPLWEDFDGDGVKELFVGRRYLAHEGKDPGEFDPQAAYRFQFDPKTRTWNKYLISYNDGICFSLDPKAVDVTGSGRLDLVVGGRHGLYWLENIGAGNSVAKGLTKDPRWFPKYANPLDLMLVKDESGQERPVKTAFDWGQRRAQILAATLRNCLVELPDPHQRVPLDVKIESEEDAKGYVRRSITYGMQLDKRVTAELLIPKAIRKNAPAMICLPEWKSDKDEGDRLADELAQRGFVCLVPGGQVNRRIGGGPIASWVRDWVWGSIRGIDLLETMPEVSTKRIGVIGHGRGGQAALLTAAFDDRVAALVASCASGDEFVRFELNELLGTLAPRPAYICAPMADRTADADSVKKAVASASAVYQLRKVGKSLQGAYPEGGREFSAAARKDAYEWLDQRLKK
jgi:hypothetical protein